MRYLFLLYGPDRAAARTGDTRRADDDRRVAVRHRRDGRGRRADRLRPAAAAGRATTVRVRDGETLLTDGPAAEIKEHFGGFTLIECAGPGRGPEVGGAAPDRGRRLGGGAPGGAGPAEAAAADARRLRRGVPRPLVGGGRRGGPPGWAISRWPRTRCRTPAPRPWPSGPPRACQTSPRAWLIGIARHKAARPVAAGGRRADKEAEAMRDSGRRRPTAPPAGWAAGTDDELGLIFTCCHPALDPAVRVRADAARRCAG